MEHQATRVLNSTQETLFCRLCSKKCSNRLSKNRHQLYCRKKLGNPNIRKSCSACRKAKSKCSSVLPYCGRCVEKSIVCIYENTARSRKTESKKGRADENGDSNLENGSGPFSSTPLESLSVGILEPVLSFPSYLSPVTLDCSIPNEMEMDSCFGTEAPAILNIPDDGVAQIPNHLISFDVKLLENCDFDFPYDLDFAPENPTEFSNSLEILTFDFDTKQESMFDTPYLIFRYETSPSQVPSNAAALIGRQSPFIESLDSRLGGNALGRCMLLENIRSYLLTFSQPNAFPPYLHHSTFEAASTEHVSDLVEFELKSGSSNPESIHMCSHIITSHSQNGKYTSPLLWEDVTKERERMNDAHTTSNPSEVLAMLQAITTYITLRIFSKESFSIEFDNQLIETMTKIAIHSERSGFLCTGEVMGHRPQWHEWTLMESKRRFAALFLSPLLSSLPPSIHTLSSTPHRTVTLLFIFHLLFEINPGQRAKALAGISLLPLPATRFLWEARTEKEWNEEYDTMLRSREGRRYLSYADMLYLGQGGNTDDPRRKDLNHWMVKLDSFGIVVMMAAAIL